MINLAPIHKKIRQTLQDKSDAVARTFDGDALDPKNKLQETYTRTTWVRMYSPVDSTIDKEGKQRSGGMDTTMMMGGEVDKDSKNPLFGFDELYFQGEEGGGVLAPTSEDGVKTHRPIPGIKDVSISFKGGLSSIREATINWTCWSFEDLERFTPHFMSHGKGVLLEWGWDTSRVRQFSKFSQEEMENGTAYSKLQDTILSLAGDYDGMAGIISNWEWELRDDGGFDCTTTIVARGVNVINADISGTGIPGMGEKQPLPSMKEFSTALKEVLFNMSTEGGFWILDSAENRKPSKANVKDWSTNSGTQPPGVLVMIHDNWFSTVRAGPYVTWGFFEDNILSKFVGRVDETGKTINSFRSISPLFNQGAGNTEKPFLTHDGTPTDEVYKAAFKSVVIRNHNYLYTPYMKRWILPGQFPATEIAKDALDLSTADEEFVKSIASYVQDDNYYRRFAINEGNWNDGGYIRNMLISYELITTAFEDANTLREGMQLLFDEINRDVDNFWKFEVVTDPYIDGNIKVIDVNQTHETAESLLEDRVGKENPESKLFTFPSWGEKSIVKSQTLNSRVPSSMAVSAMYAGTAKEGEEADNAPDEARAVTELTDTGGKDKSQPAVSMASRLGGEGEAFGSQNPYGDDEDGIVIKSDSNDKSNIPSEQNFGKDRGVPFEDIKLEDIIRWYEEKDEEEKTEDDKKREEAIKEKEAEAQAASVEAIERFKIASSDKGMAKDSKKIVFTKTKPWYKGGDDNENFSLYNQHGELWNDPVFNVLFRRTMLDFIHNKIGEPDILPEEREAAMVDPMIPFELSITIDGTGGIIPGNAFHVDYITDRYKKYCVFQAINISHTINSAGWSMDIKGQPRVAMNKIAKDKRES
tara:strand:- start:886 stop:3492 length:2607 start_codon:yes stop_codon:yes gene_type:complete